MNLEIMAKYLQSVLLLVFVMVSVIIKPVVPYSRGAPSSTCGDMTPKHKVDKQTTTPPYQLLVMPARDGEEIIVSLASETDDQPFSGFLLQARDANNRNKTIDGVFTEDQQSQIRTCNSDKANTITHRSGTPKTRIDTQWSPPDESFTGRIVIRSTIVKSKTHFWVEHDSEPLNFISGRLVLGDNKFFSPNNDRINITEKNELQKSNTQESESPKMKVQSLQLDYTVCEQRFCLGLGQSTNCISEKSCESLLSGTFTPNRASVEFELSAIPRSSHRSKYYSMALSSDTQMGDDIVTDCYVTSTEDVKIGISMNVGKSNELLSDETRSITPLQTTYLNGIISCKWMSAVQRTANGKQYNLATDRYHILLAAGELIDDTGRKQHHEHRLASSQKIDLEQVGAVSVSDLTYLIRIHGSLMVMAWIGLVSIAILLARHYKQVWVANTLCGVKIWFAFHRGLMISALILMFIAQTCIFYYVGEYRIGSHQIFGSIAFTIAIIQPIGALFRPDPDAHNRWMFNWMHWFNGNVGHITACVAIFLATGLPLAGLPKPFLWVMISFVIFHVLIHVVLQIHTFFMNKRNFLLVENSDIALKDMGHTNGMRADQNRNRDAPGSGFRRFILGLYVAIVVAFLITFITLISLPKSALDKMAIT